MPSAGGKSAVGGASRTTQGGTVSGTGGATSRAQGGATPLATGGAIATGGSPAEGGSAGPCPAYTGTGGSTVTPPSNGFETSVSGWTTVAESAVPISQVLTGGACEGSGFLRCDGAERTANWDGPNINVLPNVVTSHQYNVTVAARFDPANAPAAATNMTLTVAFLCADTSVNPLYSPQQAAPATTSWIRLSGAFSAMFVGCTSLAQIKVYVESDVAAAKNSIDLDDFQLIDVTATAGGAGGAGGVPTVGGSHGTGGEAPDSGTTSTGETDGG